MTEEVPLSEQFDLEFQDRLAAYLCRDSKFLAQAHDLVLPSQFENHATASILQAAMRHYALYNAAPGAKVLVEIIKKLMTDKRIREDLHAEVKAKLRVILSEPLTDHAYMLDHITTFARNNALNDALVEAFELKEKGLFDEAALVVGRAALVGQSTTSGVYDYFEEIESRTVRRDEMATGVAAPTGITTGLKGLDAILYHKGWGRREFVLFMGGAKAGKSTALGHFGINATIAGFNVLYVTLEVYSGVLGDRFDARLSDSAMDDLTLDREKVRKAISEVAGKTKGKMMVLERPSGSLSPMDLRRVIEEFRTKGMAFDMVCLDYLDLCRPDRVTSDNRADEKNMYTAFRALADEYNLSLLSATQTNRDGMGSETATSMHVADNIEKIRIADLVISINKTEEEKANNEARLYFAASRNQRGEMSVLVKQNLDKMKFIESISGIS